VLTHAATLYAREKGLDGEFHHAAARAYWETGADLGNMEVLRQLAQGSGLDWQELEPRLESEQYRQQVLRLYQEARELGVRGTPTYRIGGELAFGDLSVDALRQMVQKAAAG
jgi:predicted DsbA family dithiol-disulfide isomerase